MSTPARKDLDGAIAARSASLQRVQRLESSLRLAAEFMIQAWFPKRGVDGHPDLSACANDGTAFRDAQAECDAWRGTANRLRGALELAREQVTSADKRVYVAARNVAIAEMLRLAEEAAQHEARALALREEILGIDFAFHGSHRHEQSEPLPTAVTRVLAPAPTDYARIVAAAEVWIPKLTELLKGCEAL